MTTEAVRSREVAAVWFAVLSAACSLAPFCYLPLTWAPPEVRRHVIVDGLGPVAMCGVPALAPLLALGAVAAGVGAWRASRAQTGDPSVIGGVAVAVGSISLLSVAGLSLFFLLIPWG